MVWNKGLTKEIDSRLKGGLTKGQNVGHPNYYSREYLGDKFDEIEKKRVEKISKNANKEACRKGGRIAMQVRKARGTLKWSQDAPGRKSPKYKGRIPWNYGIQMPEEFKETMRQSNRNPSQARIDGRIRAVEKQKQYRGPLASNWQGGKSLEEYGEEFDLTFREEIRARDGNRCKICGIHQNDLVGFHHKLDVHHIDENKHHNDDKDNFVTLCRPCHMRLQRNRN